MKLAAEFLLAQGRLFCQRPDVFGISLRDHRLSGRIAFTNYNISPWLRDDLFRAAHSGHFAKAHLSGAEVFPDKVAGASDFYLRYALHDFLLEEAGRMLDNVKTKISFGTSFRLK